MTRLPLPILAALALVSGPLVAQDAAVGNDGAPLTRFARDLRAMEQFRPGYAFWRHVFTIPDGAIAFGSAEDGQLLAVFNAKADWTGDAVWIDPEVRQALAG